MAKTCECLMERNTSILEYLDFSVPGEVSVTMVAYLK
jgi:hypothetical protein